MTQDTYSKLIALLDDHGATYRLIDHEPEGRTDIVSGMRGNNVAQAAKCIIIMVKIGKKEKKYVLAIVPGDARVQLNAIKDLYNGTYVSFADKEIAEELAGSVAGTVLPFAFHEDLELIVDPLLLEHEELFFNAALLERSMALKTSDYIKIVEPRLESIAHYESDSPSTKKKKENKKKNEEDIDDLYKLRHSMAHVLAQAVLKLWPDTQITIGPPIETGCYYDFLFKEPISDADFSTIEKEMRKIINQGQTFRVDTVSVDESIAFWKKNKQRFKVELVEDLKKAGETEVTHYANVNVDGEEKFIDLCKGGHVENLKDLPADGFKIMSLAGAYWRGDESREQLTRLYVAVFPSKQELKDYLQMLEEAKKRDHRKLGRELDLFTFSELVGPGLPLWTPRGTQLRNLLDEFLWELREERGYQKVTIPHITKKDLYETSGHWQKFAEELFRITTREGHEFCMKPMNCPHHTQIYASLPRSYKDLPLRYCETTTCYRDEQTGELHGLSRVRAFFQDDSHVFCRENQVKEEVMRIWDIVDTFYRTVGFGELRVRLSLHDPDAFEKYLGTKELWERAEGELRALAEERGANYFEQTGEAAFYGPKVDFVATDSIGREWQVATIQLDINMPERFDLFCTNEQGEKERIVMLHAAIMGSLERFLSVFIEHHAGLFPLWLAPVQIGLLPVAGPHEDYAQEVLQLLENKGVRTTYFDPSESLGKRIREGEKSKIPYLLVLGDTEVESRSLAIRNVQSKQQVESSLDEFLEQIIQDIASRELDLSFGGSV